MNSFVQLYVGIAEDCISEVFGKGSGCERLSMSECFQHVQDF